MLAWIYVKNYKDLQLKKNFQFIKMWSQNMV